MSLFKFRRIIVVTMLACVALTVVLSLMVTPKFVATSILLVLPSSSYAAHADGGGGPSPTNLLERDSYLKNEAAILTSYPLAHATLEQLGVEEVYPELAGPPGRLSSWLTALTHAIASSVEGVKRASGIPAIAKPDVRPIDLAVAKFAEDLTAVPDKTGNIVAVSFKNKDSAVAAKVVNTLVSLYLHRRTELYQDTQSIVVAAQASVLREELDAASKAYAQFKAAHNIFNYDLQRDNLLRQQAEITRDLQLADTSVLENHQRLTALQSQIAATSPEITMYTDTDMQTKLQVLLPSLQNLQMREAALATRDLNRSVALTEVRSQIKAAKAEIDRVRGSISPSAVRRGHNPLFDQLSNERDHVEQDLAVAGARREADTQQGAQVQTAIRTLEINQVELQKLEQQRGLLADAYGALTRELNERKMAEMISARSSPNVRVIQPAEVPLHPPGSRLMVLAAGFMLTLLAGVIAATLAAVARRGYICPIEMERSLGISVLASLPDISGDPGGRAVLRQTGNSF